MNARTYNWIIHSCMLTALLSAVLFDKAPRLKGLVLGAGILSGVVAAVAYFYSQWDSTGDPAVEDSKSPELSISKIQWHHPSVTFEGDILARMLSVSRGSWQSPSRYMEYHVAISKSQQEEFSRRIARALAPLYRTGQSKELELECVLTRTGNFVFIVRPTNRIRRSEPVSDVYFSSKKAQSSGEWVRPPATSLGIQIDDPLATF
jgi:hypothetical protein